MKEIRLIKLLRSFSREELKSFGKFVESPFSKSSRNSGRLYKYLIAFHPDYYSPSLSKEEIFKRLFDGEAYDGRKLQNLIFDLTKSAEYFLAQNTFEEDELEVQLNLCKGYLNKNLFGETKRVIREIEKKLQPSFSPGKDYISKLKRLAHLKFDCYAKTHNFANIPKLTEDLFEASAIQFVFEYTQFMDNMKIVYNSFGKEIENEFNKNVLQSVDFEKLLSLVEETEYANNPHISLHFYKFKTLINEENLEHYNLFKRMLLKNLSVLDREEKWFFFAHLLNYCEQKKINNVKVFEKESLDIYKSMVENNVYSSSESQYMELLLFRNITLCCYSQKDSKWLEYFLSNYLNSLNPDHINSLENFGYAHLYFLTKDFEKSLECASGIDNEFFFFKTDIKNLLLRIYYELNLFDQAFLLIDSFKHFIAESRELPDLTRIYYKNYLKIYSKLIKIKSGESKEDPSLIKAEVGNIKQIVSKSWLLEKADDLTVKVKSYERASRSF